MDMQRRINEMKLSLDELAAAYEIPDPELAKKASLTVIVRLQLRLAQDAAWVVQRWEDVPETWEDVREEDSDVGLSEDKEGESND